PKHSQRSMCANAGSPTGRESYGDGILIVPEQETQSSRGSGKEQPSKEGQSVCVIQTRRKGNRNILTGKECEMQETDSYLGILRERGRRGLPLERVYRHLFNRGLYLKAYGRLYRNHGAMTRGITNEVADGMSLEKIDAIIDE